MKILELKIDIEKIKEYKLIKSIDTDLSLIYASIFPSGNIVSVLNDSTIKIFDKNFNLIQLIKDKDSFYYVSVRDENNFVTSTSNNSIKTYIKKNEKFELNQHIKDAHKLNKDIFQVIYYSYNNLISYTNLEINFWEENNNKYQLITTLKHNEYIQTILLLEDKKYYYLLVMMEQNFGI